jgi:hypothetical protein
MSTYSNHSNFENNITGGKIELSQPLGEGNGYPEPKQYDLKAFRGADVKLYAFSAMADGDESLALRSGDLSAEYSRWLENLVSLGTNLGHVQTSGVKTRPFQPVTEKLQTTKKLRSFATCTPRLGVIKSIITN